MNKDAEQKLYYLFVKEMGQLLSMSRLYNVDHPFFKEKIAAIFGEIHKFLSEHKKSLSLAETGNVFLVNGEKVEIKDNLMKRFLESFLNLELGSIDLEPGITMEEFVDFILLLNQTEHLRGESSIREHLKAKGNNHVIPRFASYELVREDEKVIKSGGVINVDDLPAELMERFSKDLRKGEVASSIKKEDKEYRFLAHSPGFLSGLVNDAVKANGTPDEVSKILWLIGDYLIDEIATAREEAVNRQVLDDMKAHILKLWEKKEDKERWKTEIQKTFDSISSALVLRGLILLCRKHKKEFDRVAGKIRDILKTLPPESNLYKKAKQELAEMGLNL